jgi:glutamine amidotransferase
MTGGASPVRATFWLLDAPDNLDRQSERNPDGTGLGVFVDGEPQVFKQPVEAEDDLAFAREARDLVATTWVGHVRLASAGGVSYANTHPFELDGRLFAHNGGVGDLGLLDDHLGDDLACVGGDTDSERILALLSREIARGGDVVEATRTTVDWLAEHLPVHALNFVLTTSDGLWALRYPDTHELHWLRCEAGESSHESALGTRVRSEDAPARVIVASERLDDDPGWTAIGPGELLHVDRDLTVTRHVVRDAPPRRRA